jgi:hypothetical protein
LLAATGEREAENIQSIGSGCTSSRIYETIVKVKGWLGSWPLPKGSGLFVWRRTVCPNCNMFAAAGGFVYCSACSNKPN